MAQFKADITFKGIAEDNIFNKGEEFEMTVKRSEEIMKNIKKSHPQIKKVMTRLDNADEGESK